MGQPASQHPFSSLGAGPPPGVQKKSPVCEHAKNLWRGNYDLISRFVLNFRCLIVITWRNYNRQFSPRLPAGSGKKPIQMSLKEISCGQLSQTQLASLMISWPFMISPCTHRVDCMAWWYPRCTGPVDRSLRPVREGWYQLSPLSPHNATQLNTFPIHKKNQCIVFAAHGAAETRAWDFRCVGMGLRIWHGAFERNHSPCKQRCLCNEVRLRHSEFWSLYPAKSSEPSSIPEFILYFEYLSLRETEAHSCRMMCGLHHSLLR